MSDSVRQYVDALKARQKAERAVSEITDFIKYVANALERDSNNFAFDGYRRYGTTVSRSGGSTFESARWPTAQGLQDLLIHWDGTKKQVIDIWETLPADDRAILPGPDRRS